MATVQLNAQDFEKTITDNNLVFVDFWATWCGPCRAFGPTFEAASEENPDIVFGKVDIDANQDLASAAGIQAVPTLMIAKQGQIIFKQAGALRAEDLDDLIAQAKALDVSAAAQDSAASAAAQDSAASRRITDDSRRIPRRAPAARRRCHGRGRNAESAGSKISQDRHSGLNLDLVCTPVRRPPASTHHPPVVIDGRIRRGLSVNQGA